MSWSDGCSACEPDGTFDSANLTTKALEFRPLNVLIGANGAGKSNLVSLFRMMNELMTRRLRQFVASTGRASSNLRFEPKITLRLEAELEFEPDTKAANTCRMRLAHAAGGCTRDS